MKTENPLDLVLAGQRIPTAADAVRRYCGLSWSGGPTEVWAYPYYDAVPTDPGLIEAADVNATAALHPGLSRADLDFFVRRRDGVEEWLAEAPVGVSLAEAEYDLILHLENLAFVDGVSLALLTKVLHRKRPALIPLVDRHLIDWYRPITGERQPQRAWNRILVALRHDLVANSTSISDIQARLDGLETVPSALRVIDIALWMGARS